MAQPRGQTLQRRFGFFDADLQTPSHDALMTWLTEHIDQVIIELFWEADWPIQEQRAIESEAQGIIQQTAKAMIPTEAATRENLARQRGLYGYCGANAAQRRAIDQAAADLIGAAAAQAAAYRATYTGLAYPQRPLPLVDRLVWEQPIKAAGHGIVGFADLYVEVRLPRLTLGGYTADGNYPALDGYRRAYDLTRFKMLIDSRWEPLLVFFEVKATLPSAGELIRQIRTYQTYTPGHWVVVAPDDRHRGILERQEIAFYKPETTP